MPGTRTPLGLDVACRIALAMGFDGKQCIHPAQLATVNDDLCSVRRGSDQGVAPSFSAYEAAVAAGQGAATHDGRMIDAANVRMARIILERQRLIES